MTLHESTIAQCLRGDQSFSQLEEEALSAVERVSETRERIHVASMPGELVVTREMLVGPLHRTEASRISNDAGSVNRTMTSSSPPASPPDNLYCRMRLQ